MALTNLRSLILGTFAFMIFWLLAVFPSFKLLPIGRTAGAVAGAVLMVVFQVESPSQAYDAVDLSILGLLFGTMVVSLYLERADMFRYLGNTLSWKSRGGKDLICRVCILSAVSSSLFTNDTSCIVLTEFILKLCRQKNLHPKPFLVALATSSNIGSSATPIGNPQNLVIAIASGISFGKFLVGLLPCMLLGVAINTALLLAVYWKQLSPTTEHQEGRLSPTNEHQGRVSDIVDESKRKSNTSLSLTDVESNGSSHESVYDMAPEHFNDWPTPDITIPVYSCSTDEALQGKITSTTPNQKHIGVPVTISGNRNRDSPRGSPSATSFVLPNISSGILELTGSNNSKATPMSSINHPVDDKQAPKNEEKASRICRWKRTLWKCAVYIVTAAMLAALLYGLDLSWCALTTAAALMALDFQDAGPSLDKVMYQLLVFFAGMLITVDGFNTTGIPEAFWNIVEPHARITQTSGIIILALVVMVLSNVASNVPTVLLLGSRVSASAAMQGASTTRAWLMLAWTSTVAGNLTVVGSAANLIVCEQAMKAQEVLGYELTFWGHLLFGFPSTLLVTAAGLPTIKG